MECPKCNSALSSDSKFCSNCGTRVEEKSLSSSFDKTIDSCKKVWFIFGFFRGLSKGGDKKDAEDCKKFEEKIKKDFPEIWDEYMQTIDYWHHFSTNEKSNKKQKGKA